MAAVCNFSNLLTLIIFNGFSLQANRRGKIFLHHSAQALQPCAPRSLAGTVNSYYLNCWFRTIIQEGITFSSMK